MSNNDTKGSLSGFNKTASASAEKIKPIGRGFDDHPGVLDLIRQGESLKERLSGEGLGNTYFRAWSERDGAKLKIQDRWLINFSSYNYLGLADDPDLAQAAKDAIDKYGTSVSAARIVSGQIPLYEEMEAEFADYFGTEDALIFVSGFLTNVSTIGFLFGERDLIVHDSLIHNSMVTGALLSGARRLTFPHNDAKALDKILKIHRRRAERCVVLTEGVFSMDGDVGNVKPIIDVAHKYDSSVMLDEAHSLGTIGATGRGAQEAMGLKPDDVEIWMGSLSKSIGSVGGYIAGSERLIQNLRYNAPGAALYCATSPPPSAAAALCGLRKMQKETWRTEAVQENSAYFLKKANENGLNTGIADGTAVVPIIAGGSDESVVLSARLDRDGINVQAIFYPVVPEGEARLRFFINALHTKEEMDYTIAKIVEHSKDLK